MADPVQISTLDFDKMFLARNLEQFYKEGDAARLNRQGDIDKATRMWNKEYENTDLPDDAIYYPMARNEASEIQRSCSQSFSQTDELTTVKPAGKRGTGQAGEIADAQADLMEIAVGDDSWFNKTKFLDDTTLQGVISGAPKGCVTWRQEFEEEEVLVGETTEIDPETGLEQTFPQFETRRRMTVNRPDIRYIDDDSLLWDPYKYAWPEVWESGWVMELNILKTAAELRRLVDTEGYDSEAVEGLIGTGQAIDETRDDEEVIPTAQDNQRYELRQFYGWISLTPDARDTKFCKIVTDRDFKYFVLKPTDDELHVYRWLDNRPMIPYTVGYLTPRLGRIHGYSVILLLYELQQEENAMRNMIRRSAEQDLHSVYAVRRGSGLDVNSMQNRTSGAVVWTDGDVRTAMAEFPHRDTTGSGLNDLAVLEKDKQRTLGNTDRSMGISDPSQGDTATAAMLETNAANAVKFFFISRYGQMFLEPIMLMATVQSIQFATPQQLQDYGIELPQGMTRKDLYQNLKIKVDSARGATNVVAKKKQAIENNIFMQQLILYMAKVGFVMPPELLAAPMHFMKKALSYNGEPAPDQYVPDIKKLVELSKQKAQSDQQRMQQAQQQEAQLQSQVIGEASAAGERVARDQITAAGGNIPGGMAQ